LFLLCTNCDPKIPTAPEIRKENRMNQKVQKKSKNATCKNMQRKGNRIMRKIASKMNTK
jgi:hypothetical protein